MAHLLSTNPSSNLRWNFVLMPVLRIVRILKLERIQIEDLDNATVQAVGRVACKLAPEDEHLIRVYLHTLVPGSTMRRLPRIYFDPGKCRDRQDIDVVGRDCRSVDPIVSPVNIDIKGTPILSFGNHRAEKCQLRRDITRCILLVPGLGQRNGQCRELSVFLPSLIRHVIDRHGFHESRTDSPLHAVRR